MSFCFVASEFVVHICGHQKKNNIRSYHQSINSLNGGNGSNISIKDIFSQRKWWVIDVFVTAKTFRWPYCGTSCAVCAMCLLYRCHNQQTKHIFSTLNSCCIKEALFFVKFLRGKSSFASWTLIFSIPWQMPQAITDIPRLVRRFCQFRSFSIFYSIHFLRKISLLTLSGLF